VSGSSPQWRIVVASGMAICLAKSIYAESPSPDGNVALAALDCDQKTLSAYLDAGGDPNAVAKADRKDDQERPTTLLIMAANNGQVECMRLLIKHGAKAELADADGDTALLRATRHVYRAGIESVRFLLEAGADVNHAFPRGTTPLMHAACPVGRQYADLYYATTKLLVERGADVNRRNSEGVTAFSRAEECGATRTQKLLLRAGAHKAGGPSDGR
jgi:hypothetical protein